MPHFMTDRATRDRYLPDVIYTLVSGTLANRDRILRASIRFGTGDSFLSVKQQQFLDELIDAYDLGFDRRVKVKLFGRSSKLGPSRSNLLLSEARMIRVKDAMYKLGLNPVSLESMKAEGEDHDGTVYDEETDDDATDREVIVVVTEPGAVRRTPRRLARIYAKRSGMWN